MFTYNYNPVTLEFIEEEIAYIDPAKTQAEGHDVYILPAHSTFTKPNIGKNKTALYQKETDDWQIVSDYRGAYIVDETMNVRVQTELGDIPSGYIVITEKQAQKIQEDPIYYVIDNGRLIKNPNYDEQKEQQELERIYHLSMTKYDFYKVICKPNGIGYQQLMTFINSNDDVAAAWNFCERVYRGDEILNICIKQIIPSMTDEMLNQIFEEYGK